MRTQHNALLALAIAVASNSQANTDTIQEVVVTGHPLSGERLAQASDLLQGTELDEQRAASIGETISSFNDAQWHLRYLHVTPVEVQFCGHQQRVNCANALTNLRLVAA